MPSRTACLAGHPRKAAAVRGDAVGPLRFRRARPAWSGRGAPADGHLACVWQSIRRRESPMRWGEIAVSWVWLPGSVTPFAVMAALVHDLAMLLSMARLAMVA